MSDLDRFILIDSETQIDKDGDCEYEIYGLANSWGGVLFERDINNPKQILYHVSNGLKVIDDFLEKEDCFFRKDKDGFGMHYRNCEDYNYSNEAIELTKEEIVKIIKEYVYLHDPNLMSSTCMGWDTKLGVLHDPNYCKAYVMLDDKKQYSITKRYETFS